MIHLSISTLKKIIKLLENVFYGVRITTSICIFEIGVEQGEKDIFACYIEDDRLEIVKIKIVKIFTVDDRQFRIDG